jgi:hypothetical protein
MNYDNSNLKKARIADAQVALKPPSMGADLQIVETKPAPDSFLDLINHFEGEAKKIEEAEA